MMQPEKKQNLGRGLASLLGVDPVEINQPPKFIKEDTDPQGVQMVRIIDIRPGKYQPRMHFDREEIENLANSIRENGVIQPLILRPVSEEPDDGYEIVAGERRWRASEVAGLEWVPCIVRELSDLRTLELALIENVQRKDLMPLEEAEAYQRLMDEFGHTQEELSKAIGKSRSHIANTLRLNVLPASVKQLVNEGMLSAGHVRAIIGLENIEEVAKQIVETKATVREVENIAKSIKKKIEGIPSIPAQKKLSDIDIELMPLVQKLESFFGSLVKIKAQGTKGEIVIFYESLEVLDQIMKIVDINKPSF